MRPKSAIGKISGVPLKNLKLGLAAVKASENLKFVAVKFGKLPTAQETQLANTINKELAERKVVVDDPNASVKDVRKDFRVLFRDTWVDCMSEATSKTVPQKLKAKLLDLSLGGCSFGVDPNIPLTKGGYINIELSFLKPPFTIRGQILGLRKD